MKRWIGYLFGILSLAGFAQAQLVPGRYVVELTGAPLGSAVRRVGRAGLRDRQALIRSEQAVLRPLIVRRGGRVLASLDSLLNALIVAIPDDQEAALESLPGVVKVYPVYEYHADLDHALPIHNVPAAWSRIGGEAQAGAGVKIAILDTGISSSHLAFQDPSLKMPAGYPLASSSANLALTTNKIIVARSYEDIYQETDPDDARDRNGHGTETAMCAAGVTNKGPFATITGVAPKAWIGGYKIVAGNTGSASGDVILKALDDALADGMDVVNLSFGSAFEFSPDSLPGKAIDRLTQYGVVFVTSAGNAGPGLNTLGDYASAATAISVGAIQNDRYFAGSVSVGGGNPVMALPGDGTNPASPLSAPVLDVAGVDSTGLACSPLPSGSASGRIALILRGTCSFEQKLNDVQAGGAIAAIVYTAASAPAAIYISVGAATVPAVTVSNSDGIAIKATITANPAAIATITFDGVSYPEDPTAVATFSSAGPNYDFTIKPDLTAVGQDVYMATQSLDPTGELYSKDGYISASGTSFSSPITAGAVAVLRAARPGLTAGQYRSLIVNGASTLVRNSDGWVERVQRTGSGFLNLDAALSNTVTAYPTSLSFGVGGGSLGGALTGDSYQLTLTNIGATSDTFTLKAIPYEGVLPPTFSDTPGAGVSKSPFSVSMNPGQSKTVYVSWISGFSSGPTLTAFAGGEYQGIITIQGAKASTAVSVPYWYGVPTFVPSDMLLLNPPGTQATVGSTVGLYVRVVDSIGYPILDNPTLAFQGKVLAGGGAISLSNTVYYPNLRLIQLKLGPDAVDNTYQFSFAKLPPVQVTITGVPPMSGNSGLLPARPTVVRGRNGSPAAVR